MFEVGWSEYLLIFGLALIVLGPEKLPKLAASVGRWVGRARTMARQFRDQLETEADSIRATVHDVQKDFESAASDIQTSVSDVQQEVATGLQEPPPAAAADPGTATTAVAAEAADTETTAELPTAPSVPEDSAGGSTPAEAQDERRP
jgi:sec-independent protein translocase protein TatB